MASPGQTEESFWITENYEATFLIVKIRGLTGTPMKDKWRIDLIIGDEDCPIEYTRHIFEENEISEEKAILIDVAKAEMKRRGMT